jgi:hypothetical protein
VRLEDAQTRLSRVRYRLADGVNRVLVRTSPELTRQLRGAVLWIDSLRRSGRGPSR